MVDIDELTGVDYDELKEVRKRVYDGELEHPMKNCNHYNNCPQGRWNGEHGINDEGAAWCINSYYLKSCMKAMGR